MVGNGTTTFSHPMIPIIKGQNYQFWSLKIKTLLDAQELWDVVETGILEGNANQLREQCKRDSSSFDDQTRSS